MKQLASTSDKKSKWIGGLSIASGAAMMARPREMALLYGFPNEKRLVRILGLRDIAIGVELLLPTNHAMGLRLRSISDACDAYLMARSALKNRRSRLATIGRIGMALGSAAINWRFADRSSKKRTNSPP